MSDFSFELLFSVLVEYQMGGLDWANKKFLGKPNCGKYGNEESE